MNTRLVGILIDSFPNILINGLTVTLPLTIISFALALVVALITALVQTAKIPVLRQLARFYVWVIRGTPVLVQLFVVFYGLPSLGVLIDRSRLLWPALPSMRVPTAPRPSAPRWNLFPLVRWKPGTALA